MFACKCLNVILECESYEDTVDVNSLQLNQVETQDIFFNQELRQLYKLQKVTKLLPSLVNVREIGPWTVTHCINCNLHTHAVRRDQNVPSLIANKLLNASEIEKLKKSHQLSRVYNIIISTNLEDQKHIDSLKPCAERETLKRQMDESVKHATHTTEEKIRLYAEQQELILEEYKERALRDYGTLLRNIAKHKMYVGNSPPISTKSTKSPREDDSEIDASQGKKEVVPDENVKKMPKKIMPQSKLVSEMAEAHNVMTRIDRHLSKNTTLDSECLFPLEDMDVMDNSVNSNADFSGSDTEEPSGVPIKSYQRGNSRKDYNLAKSLPMDIPNYMSAFKDGDDFDDDLNQPEETADIAASMRALARSVHGETVFGDLPRPSFRTNI